MDSPQSWNRYSYVLNSPIIHNDPTGHCFDGITTAICLGALIGAGVNLAVQYKDVKDGSRDAIDWKEVAVSGAVGAVAGLVGAAVIVPGAAALAGGSVVAELAIGGFMSGTANVVLSNTQRVAVHAIHNDTITPKSVLNEFHENYNSDMTYGAAAFGIGKALSVFGNQFYKPSSAIKEPVVFGGFGPPGYSKPMNGITHLLKPNIIQKIVGGAAQAVAEAASNSTLLECVNKICAK